MAEAIEAELYDYIKAKAQSLNCQIDAIDGIVDHIHLIVSIPNHRAIADVVMRIKESSSHHLNHTYANQTSAWQRAYAVFSLVGKQLQGAIAYVENQKQHHADQTLSSQSSLFKIK